MTWTNWNNQWNAGVEDWATEAERRLRVKKMTMIDQTKVTRNQMQHWSDEIGDIVHLFGDGNRASDLRAMERLETIDQEMQDLLRRWPR